MSLKMELFFAILILACLPSFVLSDAQGDALYALKKSLKADQLLSWNPNQVNPCTWVNVGCDSNNNVISLSLSTMGFSGTLSPQIGNIKTLTSLSLQGNGITGGIPKEFGNLTNLTTLNLSNNNLSGEIPTSLGNLTKLQFLTLSGNNLNGTIPESLTRIPSLSSLMLDSNNLGGQILYNFTGNHLNCSVNSPPFCASESGDSVSSNASKIGVILVGGCIAILLLVALFLVLCRGRNSGYKREVFVDVAGDDLISFDFSNRITQRGLMNKKRAGKGRNKEMELPLFSFSSVSTATNNFSISNKLGEGGFGPVYKGSLLNGYLVAVKRLSRKSGQGWEELKNEAMLIAKLQHKNLVKLLGCCIERDEKILIYEYLPNKSLDYFLFDPIRHGIIDWATRTHIIEGIVQGLLYLHQYSRLQIIHRDLKASNILLDKDMNPKISDFGMARILYGNGSQATNRIVGTYGYMSPEYAMEGLFSIKSDVFSFGVLLLEILSGKKNTGFYQSDSINLIGYAWDLWKSNRSLELMDPILGDIPPVNVLLSYINIALLCVQENAADRPTISDVISMFNKEPAPLPSPKKPAFSFARGLEDLGTSKRKPEICSLNDVTVSILEAR